MPTNGIRWERAFKQDLTVAEWTTIHDPHGTPELSPPFLHGEQLVSKRICPCGAEHYEVTR